MDDKQMIYELGHWAPKYILELSARLIDFYCFKCRKDIYGMTAYEHFMICCPEFIKELTENRGKDLDYVEQKRSDYLRTFGPSEEPQKDLLFPEPGNDLMSFKEVLSGVDFKEALEPASKKYRSREGYREDPEA
jgi:hypothetical protein